MTSIFTDKEITPTSNDLKKAIGDTFSTWQKLASFATALVPNATSEWHYTSAKYGWSFRVKDTKRVIIYLLPRAGYFKIAFVFGQKATDEILQSGVSEKIKAELKAARAYAEGRGIRIEVRDNSDLNDLEQLIKIKASN